MNTYCQNLLWKDSCAVDIFPSTPFRTRMALNSPWDSPPFFRFIDMQSPGPAEPEGRMRVQLPRMGKDFASIRLKYICFRQSNYSIIAYFCQPLLTKNIFVYKNRAATQKQPRGWCSFMNKIPIPIKIIGHGDWVEIRETRGNQRQSL